MESKTYKFTKDDLKTFQRYIQVIGKMCQDVSIL